ncbi:hypothetical protein GE061_007799 [Apolygus lucorum]|uniref:Cytochrome P450 n=1 Tax=Apolygus lucorum TaxID=248454 RepID=A0A8S9WMU4_APOLU|nr:hypothetical protein GE061_007799 [Apolygus lucorum]
MLTSLLILTWLAVFTFVWRWMSQQHKFWSDRGVPTFGCTIPFLGNALKFNFTNSYQITMEIIEKHKNDPLLGIYHFTKPNLMVKDLNLIQHVMIKDFHHFSDRGIPSDEKNRPFEVNLFTMCGKKWRACRGKFSAMFTTSKVRKMFPLMKDLAKVLLQVVDKNGEAIDLKEPFLQYALDVVASTAFGMDTKILTEEKESEFRRMIRKNYKMTPKIWLAWILFDVFPTLAAKLRVHLLRDDVVSYFANIVKEALANRKNGHIQRDDFLQLMVRLQEQGSLEIEHEDDCDSYLNVQNEDKKTEHFELTEDIMVGQALLFLTVGNDGTSSTLTSICYEFAMNPEIQEKARAEVREVLRSSGILDYESVNKLHYLDQCFKETLRLHPTVPYLIRNCCKEYTFPGTEISIPAGTRVMIPLVATHMDPELYPDPSKFDPERFAPEMSHPPCSFLAFGDGPRICLAIKFVMSEMKCVLAKLLMRYRFTMHPSSEVPLKPWLPPAGIGASFSSRKTLLFNLETLKDACC